MHERKARTGMGSSGAKSVVHARVGTDGAEMLEILARREGDLPALRDVLVVKAGLLPARSTENL